MANQTDSSNGVPHPDSGRPTPDVERYQADGQSKARAKGASDMQGREGATTERADRPLQGALPTGEEKGAARTADPARQDYRGDGPGKVGLTSDEQPDLVAPSGVNERDHGAADDKPMGGGTVNLDDDDMVHPRGKVTGTGGTWDATGGDSAPLGRPGAGLSDRNGPSDPDGRK
jgi:hypothetical protein